MDEWLAIRFEENRARLRAVAGRMLGSSTEADDAVQETWLRLSRADTGDVQNLGGWLTTVVSRVCLDMLRARAARREDPFAAESIDSLSMRFRVDRLGVERFALGRDRIGIRRDAGAGPRT